MFSATGNASASLRRRVDRPHQATAPSAAGTALNRFAGPMATQQETVGIEGEA